ncbi:hypothetical protein [Massilia sp. LC238]|uniref:hypothetical protein n=1 Tax=Massilia sp. LC238 TaxID=1502852 RepID=UPI0012698DF6|nr:hypothetical protein [Massilia sp. LC238]
MKTGPVQMLQLFFKKVDVEYDAAHAPKNLPNPLTTVFAFSGVSLDTSVSIAEADATQEHGQVFLVTMRLAVKNEVEENTSEQVFSPYKIDIEARALVLVLKGTERIETPENLATVNGASFLWSAMRDQILALTSRMQAGPAILPAVTFHDMKTTASSTSKLESGQEVKDRKK